MAIRRFDVRARWLRRAPDELLDAAPLAQITVPSISMTWRLGAGQPLVQNGIPAGSSDSSIYRLSLWNDFVDLNASLYGTVLYGANYGSQLVGMPEIDVHSADRDLANWRADVNNSDPRDTSGALASGTLLVAEVFGARVVTAIGEAGAALRIGSAGAAGAAGAEAGPLVSATRVGRH